MHKWLCAAHIGAKEVLDDNVSVSISSGALRTQPLPARMKMRYAFIKLIWLFEDKLPLRLKDEAL